MWPEPRNKGSSSCDDSRAVTIAILLLFTWTTINKLLEGPLVGMERKKKGSTKVKELRLGGRFGTSSLFKSVLLI